MILEKLVILIEILTLRFWELDFDTIQKLGRFCVCYSYTAAERTD